MVVRHSAGTPRKGAFSGYLNQPEATEQAWRGGWFHTGDLGAFDDDGHLYIRGRVKNMILGPSGENIFPEMKVSWREFPDNIGHFGLALAHYVERLVEAEEIKDYAEAARLLGSVI